ncbi:hypothetical protein G3N59_08425 [Paraburkholderia sp. Ac-20340]|uniref:hypothetical protein n=1 Tax=Paraburkholderia sp. Ac-20340 TaxID=2703888 RepID=UPI001981AA7A|nr:hypothetical protein [Paraburkholderia sp. Ac-20340]MBN3853398.1 hypothetical protein [Paraburkholderia sp. Ac-20340]
MESLIRIVNAEDRENLDWLMANVGAERVRAAMQRLSEGGRRPFVSALCRYLGAWPPVQRRAIEGESTHTSVGDLHLLRIRQLLARSKAAKPGAG